MNLNFNEELKRELENYSAEFKDLNWISKSKRFGNYHIKYNLCNYVLQCYYNVGRTHNTDQSGFYFSVSELKHSLGSSYQKVIRLFFDVKDTFSGGSTKCFYLKDNVVDICNNIFTDEQLETYSLDKRGRKVLSFRDNPIDKWINREGKIRATMIGSTSMKNVELNIDNVLIGSKVYRQLWEYKTYNIPISASAKDLLKRVDVDIDNITQRQTDQRLKLISDLNYRMNLKSSPKNTVTQLYKQKRSGRLYNEGILGLQNLPKDIRYLCMGGMGYYEYDIINCHWVLFQQLILMYGGNHYGSIKKLCERPSYYRDKVSKDIGISTKISKKLFLTIINGSSPSLSERWLPNKTKTKRIKTKSMIVDIMENYCGDEHNGYQLAKSFVKHSFVSELFKDVKDGWKFLEAHLKYRGSSDIDRRKNYKLISPINLPLNVYELNEKKTYEKKSVGKLVSHILQGLESMILGRIMVEEGEKFILPHHDGWISMEKVSKEVYTDMIYNDTKRQMKEYHNLNEGFKVEIKSRELTNLNQIELGF